MCVISLLVRSIEVFVMRHQHKTTGEIDAMLGLIVGIIVVLLSAT